MVNTLPSVSMYVSRLFGRPYLGFRLRNTETDRFQKALLHMLVKKNDYGFDERKINL